MHNINVYLVGKAGSGKTSCAEHLQNKGYTLANFAFPVYNLAYDYFNMDRKIKDRNLLQIIGTDVGRHLNQDIWVERLLYDIRIVEETRISLRLSKPYFVNADTRFYNEHRTLRSLGWLGIYLDVDDEIRIKRLQNRDQSAQENTLTHSSETLIDIFKDELISINAACSMQEMLDALDKEINDFHNSLSEMR